MEISSTTKPKFQQIEFGQRFISQTWPLFLSPAQPKAQENNKFIIFWMQHFIES